MPLSSHRDLNHLCMSVPEANCLELWVDITKCSVGFQFFCWSRTAPPSTFVLSTALHNDIDAPGYCTRRHM